MKLLKKVGGGVGFARKAPYDYEGTHYEADIKNGDVVKILDSGTVEPNQYGGESKNFKIKTRNGEKRVGFNQKTLNVLIDEFGDDSENFVGQDVKVILQKALIAGKKVIIPYFVTNGWALDEYGELVKDGVENTDDTSIVDLDEI